MIWKRHLYREVIKTFFAFLAGFYTLYIVMDYSIHAQHFTKMESFSLMQFFTYYLCHIIKRLEMMLPLALLISTIKVLLQMNQKNELIALFASGLKTSVFLRPFFLIASVTTGILFANFEFFIPKSLDYLETFESEHFKNHGFEKFETTSAYSIPLQSGGSLIFGRYYNDLKEFQDVYLIKSHNEIYKMKSLNIENQPYKGTFVECFKRKNDGTMFLEKTLKSFDFMGLTIDFLIRKKAELPFEHVSISELYKQVKKASPLMQKNSAKIKTQICFKLLSPFIPFIVLLGVIPYCLKSSRKNPAFMIYALSLFSFIAFFIILDAAVILGESRTIDPVLSICLPFLASFLGWGCQYYRCTCK